MVKEADGSFEALSTQELDQSKVENLWSVPFAVTAPKAGGLTDTEFEAQMARVLAGG